MSNRRRAITGLILAAVVLSGAVVWRYVDSQADPSALVTSLERGDATGTP